MNDTVSSFYPENRAGGFSRCDGTVQFYQQVHALLRPNYVVADFGAGRGAAYYQDPSPVMKMFSVYAAFSWNVSVTA